VYDHVSFLLNFAGTYFRGEKSHSFVHWFADRQAESWDSRMKSDRSSQQVVPGQRLRDVDTEDIEEKREKKLKKKQRINEFKKHFIIIEHTGGPRTKRMETHRKEKSL